MPQNPPSLRKDQFAISLGGEGPVRVKRREPKLANGFGQDLDLGVGEIKISQGPLDMDGENLLPSRIGLVDPFQTQNLLEKWQTSSMSLPITSEATTTESVSRIGNICREGTITDWRRRSHFVLKSSMRKEVTDILDYFGLDVHHLCFERFISEFIEHIFSIFSNSLKHLEPFFNSLIFNLSSFSIMNQSLDHGYIFCQYFEIFLAVA
ncbi:hypothetical protein H5410_052252 [Solanum commersonii]|uniref:Uncharacterized protein n=1 Tax=Solanum commersonii TaxID=4109 RepID=A0A9J5X0B4_SOLCO|nr:hypothetical protein H5410_052252 [Solanum commersonii]